MDGLLFAISPVNLSSLVYIFHSVAQHARRHEMARRPFCTGCKKLVKSEREPFLSHHKSRYLHSFHLFTGILKVRSSDKVVRDLTSRESANIVAMGQEQDAG